MRGIAIYMEGGGDGAGTKAALRQGMDGFLGSLKEAARSKELHWKLVCCGTRRRAFEGFDGARNVGEYSIVVLLVDSEGPVVGPVSTYLVARDGWVLTKNDEQVLHLMVQSMEAWIVADADALSRYYGHGFSANALPRATSLETVPKQTVQQSLHNATRHTRKGAYHKIRHSSELLPLINSQIVRRRCPHCENLFAELGKLIAAA